MSDFDPTRSLTMAQFRTVNGHNLEAGTRLLIVDEPSARGEVDLALARRLWAGGIAAYEEDRRPTPVETPEQEAARLQAARRRAGEADPPADDADADPDALEVPADLVTWQVDDAALGRKAGDRVTNADLVAIADREEIEVETDDNKASLQEKIIAGRAAKVAD